MGSPGRGSKGVINLGLLAVFIIQPTIACYPQAPSRTVAWNCLAAVARVGVVVNGVGDKGKGTPGDGGVGEWNAILAR